MPPHRLKIIGISLLISLAGFFISRPAHASDHVLILGPSETAAPQDAAPADAVGSDPTAKVFDVSGQARLLKKNSDQWVPVEKGMTIEAGTQILTGPSSFVDIAYDDYYANVTHLQENVKAEFKSIEPTEIFLEDGTIFNALDALDPDSSYQVATPTAVASVRGTHFEVAYDEAHQKFSTAAIPEEGKAASRILLQDRRSGMSSEPVELRSGEELNLEFHEPLSRRSVQPASPERVQRARGFMNQAAQRTPHFQELREKGRQRFESRMAEKGRPAEGEARQGRPGFENKNRAANPQADHPFREAEKKSGERRPEAGVPQKARSEDSLRQGPGGQAREQSRSASFAGGEAKGSGAREPGAGRGQRFHH